MVKWWYGCARTTGCKNVVLSVPGTTVPLVGAATFRPLAHLVRGFPSVKLHLMQGFPANHLCWHRRCNLPLQLGPDMSWNTVETKVAAGLPAPTDRNSHMKHEDSWPWNLILGRRCCRQSPRKSLRNSLLCNQKREILTRKWNSHWTIVISYSKNR